MNTRLPEPAWLLEKLFVTARNTRAHHDIWWVYRNRNDRSKYDYVLTVYKGFFRLSINAHFCSMILGICNLYDMRRKRDTICIKNLLKVLGASCKIQEVELECLKRDISYLEPLVEKVKKIRDKFCAHLNIEKTYTRILAEVEIKPDNIKEILEKTMAILNRVSQLIAIPQCDFSTEPQEDTRSLLDDLRSFIESRST